MRGPERAFGVTRWCVPLPPVRTSTDEAVPAPPAPPARPRDAATLIVVRPGDRDPLCLMGRRHADSEFMPGYYVFPGGAVEAADRSANPASPFDCTHLGAMGVGGKAAGAAALAVAAVRETYEETGVMIAAPGEVGDAPGRTFDEMRRRGVAPALGRLVYLGRAITPTWSPIRFHARFFLTRLRPGHVELGGDGELGDLVWVPLAEVPSLPTIDITRFMADYAGGIIRGAPVLPPGRPVFSNRDGRRLIRYL